MQLDIEMIRIHKCSRVSCASDVRALDPEIIERCTNEFVSIILVVARFEKYVDKGIKIASRS